MNKKRITLLTYILFSLLIISGSFVNILSSIGKEDNSDVSVALFDENTAIKIFVGQGGNDANDGSSSKPFKTIARAQQEVARLTSRGLTNNVVVYIRAGHYILSEPLKFGPEHGGDNTYSVTYRNAPGQNVIISSGVRLNKWTQGSNGMWTTKLSDYGLSNINPRNLYRDDRMLTRARHPNSGYLTVTNISSNLKNITFDSSIPQSIGGKDVELNVLEAWTMSKSRIISVNGNTINTANPMGFQGHPYLSTKPGYKGFLENDISFVDENEEWFYNKSNNTITLKLAGTEDPNKLEIRVPTLSRLMKISGTTEKRVRSINFIGLSFMYTDWDFTDTGYSGNQAGHYFENGNGAYAVIPGAIQFEDVRDSNFIFNTVSAIGSSGLTYGKGIRNIEISDNKFKTVGSNCIHIGYNPNRGHLGADWNPQILANGDEPRNIVISNNQIRRCGETFYDGNGIFAQFTKRLTIKNNTVENQNSIGIAVTSAWAAVDSSQREASIINNKISNVMKKVADGAGIYTTGRSPDSVIKGNIISDVNGRPIPGEPNNGIFFDESSAYYTVSDNISYNIDGNLIKHNRSNESDFNFGTNYFNVSPSSSSFPTAIANNAGVQGDTCSAYIFSNWSACTNNTQTRTILNQMPLGCSNTSSAVLQQSCGTTTQSPTPVDIACESYTYSDWSACSNNMQTRTIASKSPANCTDSSSAVLTGSCGATSKGNDIVCTNFTYSDWSDCTNGAQTRTITGKTPDGCNVTSSAILQQTCNSLVTSDGGGTKDPSITVDTSLCVTHDSNSDNKVDLSDFAVFGTIFNKQCNDVPNESARAYCLAIDLNEDRVIGIMEFANFAKSYNSTCN